MTKDGLRVNPSGSITLCGSSTCCPELELLADGRYKLIDDYGNACIITAEQAALIMPAVNKHQTIKEQLLLG